MPYAIFPFQGSAQSYDYVERALIRKIYCVAGFYPIDVKKYTGTSV